MNRDAIIGLVNNAALLLALGVLYDVVAPQRTFNSRWMKALLGLTIGAIGIAVMLNPWSPAPGVIFDTRSVLLSVTGLFFGALPAAIASLVVSLFRLYHGGLGAWTGVAVILTSATIGIAWRHIRQRGDRPLGWLELFGFGLVVHIAMLLWMLTLPNPLQVLAHISLPVLLIYPTATLLLCGLLLHQQARQQAGTQLHHTSGTLQSLIHASPLAIIQIDPDGIVQYWNKAAEDMFGWTSDQTLGQPLPLVQPSARDESQAMRRRVVDGQSFMGLETVRVRKDGMPIDVSISVSPIRDDQGRITGIISFIQEITERKRAETALKESEARYRSLFESNPAVMLLIDPDSLAIVDANPAACAYYGWSRQQLIQMRIDEINTLTPGEMTVEMVLARSQQRHSFLFKHRLADGAIRNVEVYSSPIERQGKGLLYSIVHDISDRVRAEADRDRMEAELRQAQKMEAVGRLAGGIAHDFNNMLTVILGYTDNTLRRIPPHDPVCQALLQIKNAAQRSADLTRQLLAFSRKQLVQPLAVNLNEAIDAQRSLLARLIGEDIKLDFVPAPDLWTIRIDPSQIDQILANLAANARDADAGTITIETANVTLDESYGRRNIHISPGDYVMLAFSDTGTGIDSATLEHIFEPFFTTKEKGQGTGLGLSTIYGIVKQNSGGVHAYSEPGMGSTFKIYLPRFTGQPAPATQPPAADTFDGSETVLVVEDEEQILLLAKTCLLQHGYAVLTSRTPAEACCLTQNHPGPIHLLLTDVVMPGMNGRELQIRIQQIKPGIKALFMSGYTANVIAHRGVLNEGVNFVQKPFSLDTLAGKVRAILDAKG